MTVVSLQDVVEALDVPSSEWAVYLSPSTGEIAIVTEDDRYALEEAENPEQLPEWQRELLPKLREAVESEDYLQLPDRFEINEWSMMERFCHAEENPDRQEELLAAIHGRGAFRCFRQTVQRLDLLEAWYRFREQAFEQIARDWLDFHQISYQ